VAHQKGVSGADCARHIVLAFINRRLDAHESLDAGQGEEVNVNEVAGRCCRHRFDPVVANIMIVEAFRLDYFLAARGLRDQDLWP